MVSESSSRKQSLGGENFLRDFMSSQRGPIDFRPESKPALTFDDGVFDFLSGVQTPAKDMQGKDTAGKAEAVSQNVASRQDIFSKFGLGILLSEFGDIFGAENSDELLKLFSRKEEPKVAEKKEEPKKEQQAQSISEDEIMKLVQKQIDRLGIRYEKSPTQRMRDKGQKGDAR